MWKRQKNALLALFLGFFHLSLALTDNRCFLENGASSENFFVSEDLPIGSLISTIRVHGDPRPGGNIVLNLKEINDSPVIIQSNSKNLTLKRKLDKEGIDGPSSVFVNLICERLHTTDPVFVIPINIRVTDANDNAPIFINAPYILNISEVTVIGTRVLQGVHAIDNDQQGPFSSVKYQVLPGIHSDYFEFENELEGTLVLKKSLDYEKLKSFNINIRAQDHGEIPKKTDTILTVNIIDADDQNPKFSDDRYVANLSELSRKGIILDIKPRVIKAYDQDLGINAPVYYSFNGIGNDYTYFKINQNNGIVTLAKDLNEDNLNHPATLVIKATQQDNQDRYALATLTIYKTLQNGIRFKNEIFYFHVLESTEIGTIIGKILNNRPNQHLRYYVSDQNILNIFSLNTKGEILLKKKLDYEKNQEYVFKVFGTDGITNDSSIVNISVIDFNEWEPRFRYPLYEFYASGNPNELIGKIEAADGDRNDKLTLSLSGLNASNFFITPSGELRLRDGIFKGLAKLFVTAIDNGNPPKNNSVPITVHFSNEGESAEITYNRKYNGGALLLAGLGAVLLILIFVIFLLIAYICKAKQRSNGELPRLQSVEKTQVSSVMPETMRNPVFGNVKSATASAMGGIPSDLNRSRISSPKVYPAPQPPPTWPTVNKVKKLSWDDKTDSDNSYNLDTTPNIVDNTNLTRQRKQETSRKV